VKLGIENRKHAILAAVLGGVLLLLVIYQFMPSSSTIASTLPATSPTANEVKPLSRSAARAARHAAALSVAKKPRPAESLDPTLHLAELASTEKIKYEGSGRNIFVAQADAPIPTPLASGRADGPTGPGGPTYRLPVATPPPPIPLKFFGFASKTGEPKKVFLSKGSEDVFIAGEGEVVDRRYKVIRITPTAVEIQDVVGSGPPQSVPLTQN
jgi:hypothetical protein